MGRELLAARGHAVVIDTLAQARRDRCAARCLTRKSLRKHGRMLRMFITDKLESYATANRDLGSNVKHHQHNGLNFRMEN